MSKINLIPFLNKVSKLSCEGNLKYFFKDKKIDFMHFPSSVFFASSNVANKNFNQFYLKETMTNAKNRPEMLRVSSNRIYAALVPQLSAM